MREGEEVGVEGEIERWVGGGWLWYGVNTREVRRVFYTLKQIKIKKNRGDDANGNEV
jgi:hypothetical protein